MNAKLDDSYLKFNSIYPEVYSQIESNGLCVTDEFRMPEIMTDNFVYSQYNYHTLTGRPSNAYRGFNYAAMNKEDGTRSAFVSRFEKGALFEMDFDAYHVRLIAKLIGYELPTGSIHTYFGKFYFDTEDLDEEQYEQSKQITFRLLYGGIDKEFLEIPFFRKVNDFVYELWSKCKNRSYVETPILKRKIYKENIANITANKLFNYFLQALETEVSTPKLQQVLEYLNGYKSKLILYTYDSILLDVDYSEAKQILPEIINIMQRGNFPVKCKVGGIYSQMSSITL
jgi:DNA polymerase I-like protein with 3'-5' exonuclease and polymerase domains